ncbi:DNA-binding transcriptional ArsR family regulator [Streptacidiphilus sp. MAP12-16]|uniref:ArsR/SmtB family transcription factor n=1 Tax=Streptacidiphilus sp. MAP12-16 TaxID=3156300 RepID=UPI003514EFDB
MGQSEPRNGDESAPPGRGGHDGRLDAASAARVATTLQALATPSRLMILARLREGACAATELAAEVGLEQSACSHQLRLLRELGLVVGERRGRSVVYALYDSHVLALLDQAIHHVEHLRLEHPGPQPADAVANPDNALLTP